MPSGLSGSRDQRPVPSDLPGLQDLMSLLAPLLGLDLLLELDRLLELLLELMVVLLSHRFRMVTCSAVALL